MFLNCVCQGVTILDCEEKTLDTITEKMVSEMVNKKEIRSGDREGVLNSLLQNRRYRLRHHPQIQTQIQMKYTQAFSRLLSKTPKGKDCISLLRVVDTIVAVVESKL